MNKKNNRIGTSIVIATIIAGMCICITRVTHTKTDVDTQETVSTQEAAETANKQVNEQMVSHKEVSRSTLPLEIGQQVEVYQIETETDFNILMDALEVRNGKIIIQISNGTVLNSIGDGQDDLGYYRNYDSSKFSTGNKVQSVFIFNPDSNATDDILYRIDTLVQ